VEAVCGDGVLGQKREGRLHDLKAVCDPIDAMDERPLVRAGRARGREAKHDLWLDAGFGQAA
jgi:hypothetical protein